MTNNELFDAVCAAPDDDGMRLAFATCIDRTDPERCEFVRLQLERAKQEREQRVPQRRLNLSSREGQLLRSHKGEWSRYLRMMLVPQTRSDMDLGCEFDRGFVNFVRIADHELVSLGASVYKWAPIQHMDVAPGSIVLSRILTAIGTNHLDSFSLAGRALSDDDAIAISECEGLARATWLDLSNNRISQRGVIALASSKLMKNKVRILLSDNPCDPTETPWFDDDGSITQLGRPSPSQPIEDAVGSRVPWLHFSWATRAAEPDRYHARWFAANA